MSQPQHIAPGVYKLALGFVNAYFVGANGDAWVLVDTGMPRMSGQIVSAAREVYGDCAPQTIVLTHGHVDHAGSALELAREWQVPVLCSARELPFVTGRSDYPPKDPTVGGFMGAFSRALPTTGIDLRPHVAALETLPSALDGWQVVETPGHTPGHLSFFRASDGVLIVGDALATCDVQSWLKAPIWKPEVAPPPAPFTPDWNEACASIETLAQLSVNVIGAGHGQAMEGEAVRAGLKALSENCAPPRYGRYVYDAPEYDDAGALMSVPPPAPDKQKMGALFFSIVALTWLGTKIATRK